MQWWLKVIHPIPILLQVPGTETSSSPSIGHQFEGSRRLWEADSGLADYLGPTSHRWRTKPSSSGLMASSNWLTILDRSLTQNKRNSMHQNYTGIVQVQVIFPSKSASTHTDLHMPTNRHVHGGDITWTDDEPLHNPYRDKHSCQVRSVHRQMDRQSLSNTDATP